MRNLKRALSLTLASVMLLGMMVVGGSAAGYSDVDDNDNVEAIEVLQEIEVMVGDDRGFGPDRPVTRNEMAVVMGKLLNLDYNYYTSTCPFTDVAEWAKGWVGACAANGIVSGRGNGIYDGESTVTAIEAASMMMRALGYFKNLEDYADGFQVVTVRQGSQIGIFNGVGTNAVTPMTRNQVAQMALNALRSEVVDFTGTPGMEVNGVKVGYRAEYTARTGTEAKYRAIEGRTSDVASDANHKGQYYVQLGEELYDGKLKLDNSAIDDFGRPSRKWEYDGTKIGTYAKEELIREEYTTKVTGKMLYDLLGKDYDVQITIDGVDVDDKDASTILGDAYFTQGNLVRTNTNGVGGTGKGVLTQVFVDPDATPKTMVHIAIINTYLAKAAEDYDTKNEEVDFNVYGIKKTGGTAKAPIYAKDVDVDDPSVEMTVKNEDIFVEDVKEKDIVLVTVAAGEIKTVIDPERVDSTTITTFKRNDYVTANGERYDHASTALYDVEVLEAYNDKNMKDLTYNIILDRYGYLIGLELNEDPDQYVFITGRQAGSNDLGNANADMRAIFLDGSVKVIEVNVKDSDIDSDGPFTNTWCTYTVDKNGIYVLEEIDNAMADGVKVAQSMQNAYTDGDDDADDEFTIDKKHVSLDGSGTFSKVYGNDNTVYLEVSLSVIGNATSQPSQKTQSGVADKYYTTHASDPSTRAAIIDDVESVTTGVKNVSLKATDMTKTRLGETEDLAIPVPEVYTLYKDNGYVIAAVVIGESDGVSSNFAYITDDNYSRESYSSEDDEWTWSLAAVVNGEKDDLNEAGNTIKHLKDMKLADLTDATPKWYKVKYDAKNNVRGYETISFASSADKYIDAVELVEDSVEDHDTVLMMVDYTGTAGALTYKDAGTLYTDKAQSKGFSVSPSVKTVVALSKLNKDGTVEAFDSVEDGYEGYTGLKRALSDLDSKATTFKGYLSVVFEDGVATSIILDDRTGTAVDTGTTTKPAAGKYSSVIDTTIETGLDALALDDTDNNDLDGEKLKLNVYGGGDEVKQIKDALAAQGYEITEIEKTTNTSTKTEYTIKVVKDGVKETIKCCTKSGTSSEVDVTKYWIVDIDGEKQYVADGADVTVTKETSDKGTGFIVSTDGGTSWAYGDEYGTDKLANISADTMAQKGYVSVTVTVTGTATNADSGVLSVKAGYQDYAVAEKTATITVTVESTKNTINTGVKLTGDNTAASTATIAATTKSVNVRIALDATETADDVAVELTASNAS